MTPPPDRRQLDRLLAQAKQTETMVLLEARALQQMQADRSPWAKARRLRARNMLDELDHLIRGLQGNGRDLQLRLKVMSHAVLAARTYAKIGQAIR
ncbi:hypothetical protein [Dongia rigui]|uniref:Uncharacterized protein n=1 Tax=Dongia rigui TaxID=940149 RepID=A0ABU5DTN0_9PROT|nr:hypothetical protein [Dongia rigui]MDY0870698.1 hypothetical protein [Dongia rigui]